MNINDTTTTWFVTGASRGFGRELVTAALQAGDAVVATARDPQRVRDAFPDAGERLLAVALDVTDEAQARTAITAATEHFGRIDVLVNNAGYGLFGAVEEIADAEARALFDTNVFGLLNVTRAALPTLREQGHGHVVNVGSSAGFVAGAGRGMYGASKFAVEAITEALAEELVPHGVHVTVIEPGSMRTDFLTDESRRAPATELSAYADTVGKLQVAVRNASGHQPVDPVRAAAAVRTLVAMAEPPVRLQLGSDSVGLVERKLADVAEQVATLRALAVSSDSRPDRAR